MSEQRSGDLSPLLDIEFANEIQRDPVVEERMDQLTKTLISEGFKINPLTIKYFHDPNLFRALSQEMQSGNQLLLEYIMNVGKFNDLINTGDISGLLGEEVHLPESKHSDGRVRRAEDGYKINLDHLRSVGIDPTKVLFFRVTQPMGEQPKPEYYWTSDYYETLKGLTREIPPSQRKTAIILVADLQTINENGGLIQDINDDNGIAVRQIGLGSFDQKKAIATISAPHN